MRIHTRLRIALVALAMSKLPRWNKGGSVERMATGDDLEVSRHLYETLRGGTHLVFANRRAEVERFADLLRRQAARAHLPNEFWPHHGSLSREIREEAEARLRGARPATVVATTTLELGIDIGSVDSIAQIGTPGSVASLRQRLGRSGRRAGAPSVIRIYVQEDEIGGNTAPQDLARASRGDDSAPHPPLGRRTSACRTTSFDSRATGSVAYRPARRIPRGRCLPGSLFVWSVRYGRPVDVRPTPTRSRKS